MTDLPPDAPLTPEEEDLALAAEYVLGLLEPGELRAFEARLGGEPRLRGMVARWADDLAAFFDAAPEVAPPASAREAVMRRLFPEEPRPGFLGRFVPWLLGAATAAVLVFGALSLGLLTQRAEPEYQARIAAEDESIMGPLVVMARFDADTRRLEVAREVGDIPEDRDLELWFVRMEDGAPASTVSLGVLPRDPTGVIEVSAELAAELPQNALALSVEPVGGSPTGQATGPVVALGALSEL